MIKIEDLYGGYSTDVIKGLSLQVNRGEFLGIIGPNGSGKSTLVKLISGILPIRSGSVYISNKELSQYDSKDLAKEIAVLSQHNTQYFSFTTKETVELGRYAFKTGLFKTEKEKDREIVDRVMKATGVYQFKDLTLDELSGGERQRVMLAQALAQEPHILILDEPTNHLDLAFQKELLDLLKKSVDEKNLTVVSIFHDLNIASLYCDRLMLLNNGEVELLGKPEHVIQPSIINKVYQTEVEKYAHTKQAKPQIMLIPKTLDEKNTFPKISKEYLKCHEKHIELHSPIYLRTMSSGVLNSGVGWYKSFINRRVGGDYNVEDYKTEMREYLTKYQFNEANTVAMMTAAYMENMGVEEIELGGFSLLVVVTAGINNAIDASRGTEHAFKLRPGTINTWIFVSGDLTEEAFLQSIVTATEAKTIALREYDIRDQKLGTLATGTSTDSILIAATQKGEKLEFAGPITPLGSHIGEAVYRATKQAIKNYYKSGPKK